MLITEKPEGLTPTPNDLDNIPDDLLGPHPARVELGGKILFVMDKPIEMGEYIKVELTIGCYDDGRCKVGEEIVHYRKTKLIAAKPISDPYTPEADPTPSPPEDEDPTMFDRDGQIPEDEPDDDEPVDESGLDEFNPAFSHNGVAD